MILTLSKIVEQTIAIMLEPSKARGINIASKIILKKCKICDEKYSFNFRRSANRYGSYRRNVRVQTLWPDAGSYDFSQSFGGGFPCLVSKYIPNIKPACTQPLAEDQSFAKQAEFKASKTKYQNAKIMGAYLLEKLTELKEKFNCILEFVV